MDPDNTACVSSTSNSPPIPAKISPPHERYGEITSSQSSSTSCSLDDLSVTSAGQGECSDVRPRAHVLPPCKVCGGKATGFHYGANTCEACKGFFRRSLLRTEDYKCLQNIKCNIRPGKRNLCAACRYQRCLAAGMSKDGIKTGRYTYAKRTQDILELRQLQQEKAAAEERVKEQETEKELLSLVEQVERAHYTHAPSNEPTLMAADKMQAVYLNTRQRKNSIASSSSDGEDTNSLELSSLCQQAGLGPLPDDRRSVWQGWMISIEKGLKGIVNFSKDLPGFKSLNIKDQIALLKHSVCEIWLISRHKAFNTKHSLYTAITGFTFDVKKAVGDDISSEVMTMAARLQKLQLSFQETHMLKAFVLFFADRCELQDAAAVEQLQKRYMDALQLLLSRSHSDDPHIFTKLILVLTDLRAITELYFKHIQKVLSDMKVPPLFMEILSSA